MNVLDKVISFVSPVSALKRVEARKKIDVVNSLFGGGGYGDHGASYARKSLAAFNASKSNADDDIIFNLETLRSRSRDLYMGGGFATGALKTIRTNVIGSGLMLSANPDYEYLGITEDQAKSWRKNVEREWSLFADSVNCDVERKQNFYQIQSLVILSALMSGDVFVTMPLIKRAGVPYDLCIGTIEADRICDPIPNKYDKNIYGGVEVNTIGETIAYWICNQHPGASIRYNSSNLNREWKRVLAFGKTTGRRNILHIMCDIERPSQRRGVPLLAPVIELLKQLSRYTEAELMAAVVSGMFTVFVKSNSKSDGMAGMFGSAIPGMPETEIMTKDPLDYEMGNGAIVHLDENEDIHDSNPGRPNPAFDGFVLAICRQIGASIEIPYELLVKHFTASYSAARAALLEAWKMFRMRREWLVFNLCQPVYEEWLTEAVLKGRINAPGFFDDPAIRAAWARSDWYGDSQGQLDPLKEANAARVRVESLFSTKSKEAAELTGMKFDEIIEIRKREEEMSKAYGLKPSSNSNENKKEEEDD